MDVSMGIVTGGGKKANRMTHSCTLKEVTTFDEAIDYFRKEFKSFFPPQALLTDEPGKKEKAKK
jgi:hypothetical protein